MDEGVGAVPGLRPDRHAPTGCQASAARPTAQSRGSLSANAFSFAGLRSGRPCPKQTSSGSSAASRRIDSRLRTGSGVKNELGSCRPGNAGDRVDVREHVAADQRAVGLAPERDVAGRVPGDLEHLEPARRCRPPAAGARPGVAGPGSVSPISGLIGCSGWRSMIRPSSIASASSVAAPQRDAERVADLVARRPDGRGGRA